MNMIVYTVKIVEHLLVDFDRTVILCSISDVMFYNFSCMHQHIYGDTVFMYIQLLYAPFPDVLCWCQTNYNY
jgi:hypothetical protein